MKPMDRRKFLQTATAATLTASSLRVDGQTNPEAPGVTLALHTDLPGPAVPQTFIGLSYETRQLADPAFFSPENSGLVARFRELSPSGVLRLGGNTSDVGWWKPTAASTAPDIHTRVVVGEPNASLAFAVTPEAIRSLHGFLEATGWKCLYGINLGTNTPTRAAEEASFVATALGPRLVYFQLGNEPDLFSSHLRNPATWSVDLYLDEWLAMANAILARVPAARFGLPDTSGNPEWSSRIADRLATSPIQPHLAAVTHHYYFGGPPSNPDVNISRLLQPDSRVRSTAATTRAAADKLHIPYRMTEGNTCYRGGKPGVSDVFASALWAADYALLLASLGYAGVHLHGGGGPAVASSLGGTLPGEALITNPTAPHPRPFYTPIADIAGRYIAEPVFFGLQFAGHFAGTTMNPVDFHPLNRAAPVNVTTYAARTQYDQILLAVINKDATQSVPLDLPGFSLALTLAAPSLDSRSAALTEPSGFRSVEYVPPATAVLLQSTRS